MLGHVGAQAVPGDSFRAGEMVAVHARQIHRRSRARVSVARAIRMMAVTTTQNSGEWTKVCALKLTFIPATPARSAPGRSKIEARVRTFIISFVRCSVRTISTSNELAIPSLTSRAEARAASTLAVSATNRSADSSEESGSNSEWLNAANTSRCGAS